MPSIGPTPDGVSLRDTTGAPPPFRRDYGFAAIVVLLASIALWLIAMPYCEFIQRATLRRFHLQTDTFVRWAAQAPIPAMYNFHNTFEVFPAPGRSSSDRVPLKGTLNHFPVRLFTFGDNREVMFRRREKRTLTLTSRYREQSLTTRWIAIPAGESAIDLDDQVLP